MSKYFNTTNTYGAGSKCCFRDCINDPSHTFIYPRNEYKIALCEKHSSMFGSGLQEDIDTNKKSFLTFISDKLLFN